ncbi:ABC transporter permease [Sphingobacterium sp. E70]|uniref:ABC transporter permease n=1 Tax=Sphingobacterium sp. E70 TaxID=2853439 RepID=UPI00359C6468
MAYVDASFFKIFTLPLIKGDANTAVKMPYTAVISESMARKYFGTTDVVGRDLAIKVIKIS